MFRQVRGQTNTHTHWLTVAFKGLIKDAEYISAKNIYSDTPYSLQQSLFFSYILTYTYLKLVLIEVIKTKYLDIAIVKSS